MSKHDKKCPYCNRILSNGELAPVCAGICVCRGIVKWNGDKKIWEKYEKFDSVVQSVDTGDDK